ncbi:MAG: hypothetical protein K9K84_06545 [Methylovulum sp.]|jgi:hypothetical protein|nr:hypothetical protein [Methylovulum sp.]
MSLSLNLPRIIAFPIVLVSAVASVVLFSVFFAVLLIPISVIGFKIWKTKHVAQKNKHKDVIDAQYTVLKNDDK